MSSVEARKAKPEMFHAWIERGRMVVDNTLKWEVAESVPFSATLFTPGPPGPADTAAARVAGVVPSRAGRYSASEEDEKGRCHSLHIPRGGDGGSTLQVAVLLQMPSPSPPPLSPSHTTVTRIRNDVSVRGELVIGVVEIPWAGEHHAASSRSSHDEEFTS